MSSALSRLAAQFAEQMGYPKEDDTAMAECRLMTYELFWRNHFLFLKDRGYLLRPRYHPDWIASWKGRANTSFLLYEDGQILDGAPVMMDGTRISDGATVMLKKVNITKHPDEADIGRFFSSEPQSTHADNHCVPVYDVLQIPDDENMVLIIMPLLADWDEPPFNTVGETVEFFWQLFKGLEFMHSNHVAHNDVKFDNIMMDHVPLYGEPPHPACEYMKLDFSDFVVKPRSRTLRPIKYYLIDFGHARRYDPSNGPPREYAGVDCGGYGGDGSVPEFKTQEYCDPFPVDVFRLGNFIREKFTEGHNYTVRKPALKFMEPFVRDMCQEDPTKRPTMSVVVTHFAEVVAGLGAWKLRSRVADADEDDVVRLVRNSAHWAKQVARIVRRIPAIPTP